MITILTTCCNTASQFLLSFTSSSAFSATSQAISTVFSMQLTRLSAWAFPIYSCLTPVSFALSMVT